ncbi:MAG TPA: tripartite tricarboxylate transporter substrate binding protein [Casimicrobiaceae bacterium]|nr:tripartite tricarboxylate transporter substrate binding protein [Casimicrobiaceae bacterium]
MPPTPVHGQSRRSRTVALLALCAIALAVALPAAAQPYPSRPVRLMVGASPGGGTDIVARMLGKELAETMKQPFVIENKPGASNTIAADITAKSPPDGYTLLVATNTGQAIAPHLMKLGFDVLKDLTPVALVMVVPNVLIVGPSVTAKDVRELVAQMKANPGAFNFASSGSGSTQHLAGEAFKKLAGVQMTHIPYKGSSQAHLDLISGNAQLMFDTTSSAIGQIKGGKVRALAVTTPKRSPELPDVPTLAEAGFPGLEMTTWYGVLAPAGTPKDVVSRLHAEIMKALQVPDVQKRIAGLAGEPGTLTIEQFAALNRADYDRFGKLVRESNIKLDE